MPPGLCFAFTVTAGCRGVSPKKLRTLLPQRDCFRFTRNSPHGCAIRNGLGHKSQAGRLAWRGRGYAGRSRCGRSSRRRLCRPAGRAGVVFFRRTHHLRAPGRQADAWPWPAFGLCWSHEYAQPIISRAPSWRPPWGAGPAGSRQGREKTFSAPPSQRGQGQPGAGRGQARPVPPFRASCFQGASSAGSRPGQNGPGQEGGTAGTCRRGGPLPAPLAAGAPGAAARGPASGAGAPGPSLARPAPLGPAQRGFQRAGGGA